MQFVEDMAGWATGDAACGVGWQGAGRWEASLGVRLAARAPLLDDPKTEAQTACVAA
jgi:hypothetical protein